MTEPFDFANHPHRRKNPLTGDWVLVSAQRNKRPWQGQIDPSPRQNNADYEPDCYLCPGNTRINGAQNPHYDGPFVFDNDFPALTPESTEEEIEDPLFSVHTERGTCRVMAYSADHNKTLAELSQREISQIINGWIQQVRELGEHYEWVQIFENKGEMMGCSMPHPHGQIWAQKHPPTLLSREQRRQAEYHNQHGKPLLLDYAQQESQTKTRTVVANEHWIVVVPFWAAWPFETLLLPRFAVSQLPELEPLQQETLAQILQNLLIRYDNLFKCSFPYSMGWHGAPSKGEHQASWQLHAHFYPPLLRSQNVRKFMVGYEMLAEAQRDLTPEQAAEILRKQPSTHYKTNSAL